METPQLVFNKSIFEYIRTIDRDDRKNMMTDLELLGEGAAGTTFTAYLKPKEKFSEQLVLKEQSRSKHCTNEFEALKILREEMMASKIPAYFIFMYGTFSSGNKRYIILERADYRMDDYLSQYNFKPKTFLQIFYHVANGVSYLENMQFNHGDLWSENVLLVWHKDDLELPMNERRFSIKIIDFDSAFKENSEVNNPSYGGAEKYRKKYILGYDLNRFYDALIYSYESYLDKKLEYKKSKISKLKKMQKKGHKVKIPSLDEEDSDDEAFDRVNIVYPQEIVDFMYKLGPQDPNVFKDCPDMSGKNVMKMILDYAKELGLDLSTQDRDNLLNDKKMGDIDEDEQYYEEDEDEEEDDDFDDD